MACTCEVVEIEDGFDGFFYHKQCGLQVDGVRATEVDNDEMLWTKEHARDFVRRAVDKAGPQPKPRPKFWVTLEDGLGPTYPVNLSFDDYYTEIRKTYVMGVQMMIQLQIKALVEEFKVCPLIVDMIEPVWLRFVNSINLFSDDWGQNAIDESESQLQGEIKDVGERKGEPRNFLGKRCVMIWYRSLSNAIPLSYSLAFSFLACLLAREPILSTDILKWALEGRLPYFAAFVEINRELELPTVPCPLTSSRLFRPTRAIPFQKLESLAASIAQAIGLELPSVNFPAIASRYLKQLSLPVNIILPHACRIYEWSMPPELWLSANEFMLPTRAFILSILVVSIRILYNIHGFGKWEMSLSIVNYACSRQSEVDADSVAEPCNRDLDATEILVLLYSKYHELIDASGHAKDLEAYLEYCEKVVFADVEMSYADQEEDKIMKGLSYEDQEENKIIKCLSNEDQKEDKKLEGLSYEDQGEDEIIKGLLQFYKEKKKDHKQSIINNTKKPKDEITFDRKKFHRNREIRQMKSDMEENKFSYIPPRKRVKRHDYLHYTRKKRGGAYVYAAHADYYILLRSCARVAHINVRSMHDAVLSFERRLGWLEKNIQHSFKLWPLYEDCELCDLSKLRL